MDRELWLFNGMTLSKHNKWDVEEVIEGIGSQKFEEVTSRSHFSMEADGSRKDTISARWYFPCGSKEKTGQS